jgi:hypothetical protein
LQRSGQSGYDIGRPRSPIETGDDRLLDLQGIHQSDGVHGQHRLLTITGCFIRKKSRRAIAAQIGDDDAVAGRCQLRRDIDEAMDVVGPAVEEKNRRSIRGAGLDISNIEDTGIDLLQRGKRRIGSGSNCCQPRRFGLAGLRLCRADHTKLGRGGGHGCGPEEPASIFIDFIRDLDRFH